MSLLNKIGAFWLVIGLVVSLVLRHFEPTSANALSVEVSATGVLLWLALKR